MGQILTLELHDCAYAAIQRQTEAVGKSPAHWIASRLEQPYGHLRDRQLARAYRTEAEQQAARERFEPHLGESIWVMRQV